MAELPRLGVQPITFQVGVEPPDQRADTPLDSTLLIGGGVELVLQPVGMQPAERVPADYSATSRISGGHQSGWSVPPRLASMIVALQADIVGARDFVAAFCRKAEPLLFAPTEFLAVLPGIIARMIARALAALRFDPLEAGWCRAVPGRPS